MSFPVQSRTRSVLILAGAILLATGVWGLYAWRVARSSPAAQVAAADAPRLTPLRATRAPHDLPPDLDVDNPADPNDAQAPLATAVRVNAPPSLDSVVEIKLKPSAPTIAHASVNAKAPPPAGVADIALAAARSARGRGDLLAARANLMTAFTATTDANQAATLRAELSQLADALLFSRATNASDPLVGVHVVAPGESLYQLARQEKVTERLLAKINRLDDPNRLRVGQRLKIVHGPFRAVIHKSAHRMDVFIHDVLVKSYAVGLGSNGNTPTGVWLINGKLENPDWTDPATGRHFMADDPDNPIGERWLGLEGVSGEAVARVGFGIHGTIDNDSVGRNESLGCIRMHKDDVQTVFDLLVDRYSQVEIVP